MGFWQSADGQPISRLISYLNDSHIIGQSSADHRSHLSSADMSADRRPIIKF